MGQIDRDDLLAGFQQRGPLQTRLQQLGDEAASVLGPDVRSAVVNFENVVVLTHVPPFREASWYGGQLSPDEWLPNTTCKAIGDLLQDVARASPSVRLKVLCGHTHGGGHARIEVNMEVTTQAVKVGSPDFVMLDVP